VGGGEDQADHLTMNVSNNSWLGTFVILKHYEMLNWNSLIFNFSIATVMFSFAFEQSFFFSPPHKLSYNIKWKYLVCLAMKVWSPCAILLSTYHWNGLCVKRGRGFCILCPFLFFLLGPLLCSVTHSNEWISRPCDTGKFYAIVIAF